MNCLSVRFKDVAHIQKEGLTLGRFDVRSVGRDRDDAGELNEYDPSFAALHGMINFGPTFS